MLYSTQKNIMKNSSLFSRSCLTSRGFSGAAMPAFHSAHVTNINSAVRGLAVLAACSVLCSGHTEPVLHPAALTIKSQNESKKPVELSAEKSFVFLRDLRTQPKGVRLIFIARFLCFASINVN